MRYALRNQKKIKAHFEPNGQELLNRIIKSLDTHFEKNETIEIFDSGEEFPLILISDVGHTVNVIAFYVLEIKFDVYRLAFKEFIG